MHFALRRLFGKYDLCVLLDIRTTFDFGLFDQLKELPYPFRGMLRGMLSNIEQTLYGPIT